MVGKDMALADAIQTAIEAERRNVMYRRVICGLSAVVVCLFIAIVGGADHEK